MPQPDDPPHTKADDLPDDQAADARWLTFEEIARARGISKLSAAALVRRHGWRRQRDNRGRVIALVPNDGPELRRTPDYQADRLPDHRPHQPNPPHHQAAFESALSAIEAAHAREISALRERADTARALADHALTQLANAEKRADAERSRADRAEQALAGERTRADVLRDKLEESQGEARKAQDTADQARQHVREAEAAIEELRRADTERRGQGRWGSDQSGMAGSVTNRTPPDRRESASDPQRNQALVDVPPSIGPGRFGTLGVGWGDGAMSGGRGVMNNRRYGRKEWRTTCTM